jgi:hypothetical protein
VQPEIPAHRRQRQEDREFQTNLGFLARPCLKKTKINKTLGCMNYVILIRFLYIL